MTATQIRLEARGRKKIESDSFFHFQALAEACDPNNDADQNHMRKGQKPRASPELTQSCTDTRPGQPSQIKRTATRDSFWHRDERQTLAQQHALGPSGPAVDAVRKIGLLDLA